MSFVHRLKYAGSDPFEPEQERDDISHEEYELLTQDTTYQRLAEVRYLADQLELECTRDTVPNETADRVFTVIADRDADLQVAVDAYVDMWLEELRADDADAGEGVAADA